MVLLAFWWTALQISIDELHQAALASCVTFNALKKVPFETLGSRFIDLAFIVPAVSENGQTLAPVTQFNYLGACYL